MQSAGDTVCVCLCQVEAFHSRFFPAVVTNSTEVDTHAFILQPAGPDEVSAVQVRPCCSVIE